ncbi:MAG: 4-(cytidine 5'-diphospho)-2-C-methyl-D-erythritol kinase [Oscillospiraceae bacterium]|jgi:4-diphosphocytidyl-2-C-methyl-D-erythritol kinase|nr:4-(cytidine 5'-diphospho)-2-C-methyl-D-erythritol kinase [Oscillospiraceae bacterium]
MQVILQANAKINLLLDVTGRRADGYHEVAMLMQSVDLHDTVTLRLADAPGIAVFCDAPSVPADERNVAWKAANAFFAALGRPAPGLAIAIEKRIPSAAGLAGGSADAAAALEGLRRLFAPQLPSRALESIALSVGADVPFCLRGGHCLATGVGEVLRSLPCLPAASYTLVLAKPACGVATGEAYVRIDALTELGHPNAAAALRCAEAEDWDALFPLCGNLFEQALPLEMAQRLAKIRKTMWARGAKLAQMSGSGSTVFGIFDSEAQARSCANALRAQVDLQVFVCHAAAAGIV